MTRYKQINGEKIAFTPEEKVLQEMLKKAYSDDAPNRRMIELRKQRNELLEESDFMGMSDYTMTNEWKTYRQALRDITKQAQKMIC